jgi:hypothetical protein
VVHGVVLHDPDPAPEVTPAEAVPIGAPEVGSIGVGVAVTESTDRSGPGSPPPPVVESDPDRAFQASRPHATAITTMARTDSNSGPMPPDFGGPEPGVGRWGGAPCIVDPEGT